jgi:hypothetical protein
LLRVAKSRSVIAGAGNECETATSCMLNIPIITSIVYAWNSDFHPAIKKKVYLHDPSLDKIISAWFAA